MKHNEIKSAVTQYLQSILDKSKQDIIDNGPFSHDRIQELEQNILEADFISKLAIEGMIEDDDIIFNIISSTGLKLSKGTEKYQNLRINYYKALPAAYREIIRFSEAQETFDFTPQYTTATEKLRARGQSYPLDQTATRFIAMQVEDQKWDKNTKDERLAHIGVLNEIVGPKFDMNNMDAEKARYVRDVIKRLPRNRNKNPKLRSLPLLKCLDVSDVPRLAPATISKYMETYNALFSWAVDEGYINKNHFNTLRVRANSNKDQAKRSAFSPDQIKTMHDEILKGRNGLANKDYRYWGTLVAMYTGARLNEVAQIMLDDIKQEDGIWYFDMNDDGDNKKLKTGASRRYVPIHDRLLDLGLIAYRDKLKRQGKKRLLDELTYCPKNGYGKKLGHFFNQVFLPALGLKKNNVVFHCLRHTVITRLLQAGEDLAVIQTIVGHERSGTALKNYFHEGYKLSRLREAINKLHPQIDSA